MRTGPGPILKGSKETARRIIKETDLYPPIRGVRGKQMSAVSSTTADDRRY
jgi:hypothetical protein